MVRRRVVAGFRVTALTLSDPFLPLLLLGSVAAGYLAYIVFAAPANVALGIVFVGCLTAVIETKLHNDRSDD